MSDFEDRLSRALVDGAEDAPGAAGLTDGARRRLRTRRRRLATVGAVAAVVALSVPVAVLAGSSEGPLRPSEQTTPPVPDVAGGWQTVRVLGVDLAIPDSWSAPGECGTSRASYVSYVRDSCGTDGELQVLSEVAVKFPGPSGRIVGGEGAVRVGDYLVSVTGVDRDLALRILGSARPADDPDVPSVAWKEEGTGCVVDVPADMEIAFHCPTYAAAAEQDLLDEDGRILTREAQRDDDGRWWAVRRLSDNLFVEVSAPTQAIADLMLQSARWSRGSQAPELMQQVSSGGAAFEVPVDWTSPPACDGAGPARPTFGPGATPGIDCRDVPGVFVYASALFDPAYGPGVQECESSGWCGYVIAGPAAVFIRGVDRATAEHVLDSVRSDEPGSGEEWRTVTYADLDLDLPPGFDEQDPAACGREVGYEAGIMVPFSGLDPCRASPRLTVQGEAAIDFETGLYEGGGSARIGNQAVFVANVDRATARRVLASVRPAGTALPDLTVWTTVTQDGVTAEVPADGSVEVVVRSGVPRCLAAVSEARPVADNRWAADWCRNRIVTILAPTEALAEVVAATIRD